MNQQLKITAKGQVTLRKTVLRHLGAKPGQKVDYALLPDGRVELSLAQGEKSLSRLLGILARPGQRAVTLEEMQDAIEAVENV